MSTWVTNKPNLLSGHQEKAVLYLVLGVCVGLILLLTSVLARVCYRMKRNTHAKLDMMEPTHSRNISHLVNHMNHHSVLETPMLEHSDSIDRIEVVRFEPRGTMRSGYHSTLHSDSGDRSLNNYYGWWGEDRWQLWSVIIFAACVLALSFKVLCCLFKLEAGLDTVVGRSLTFWSHRQGFSRQIFPRRAVIARCFNCVRNIQIYVFWTASCLTVWHAIFLHKAKPFNLQQASAQPQEWQCASGWNFLQWSSCSKIVPPLHVSHCLMCTCPQTSWMLQRMFSQNAVYVNHVLQVAVTFLYYSLPLTICVHCILYDGSDSTHLLKMLNLSSSSKAKGKRNTSASVLLLVLLLVQKRPRSLQTHWWPG